MSELSALQQQVEALNGQIAVLVEQQRRRDELWQELTPIMREALGASSERLASLEERGYFRFGQSLLNVVDRVIQGYSADDVEQLANSIVTILDTVRAITQPHVLKVVGELGNVVERADDVKPVGVLSTVKAASRDEQVQRGMAVMLEVLRHVGQGAEKLDRRERLRQQLAARSPAGPSRAAPARTRTAAAPARAPAGAARSAPPAAPQVAPPSPPPAAPLGGFPDVSLSAEGFLTDASQWSPEVALAMAKRLGMESLTDAHWKLIEYARSDFEQTGASPNIRRLTRGSGIGTKDIYRMFPRAPGKCTAMVAGLPKPVGCI